MTNLKRLAVWVLPWSMVCAIAMLTAPGCAEPAQVDTVKVPQPWNLMLPHTIRIHPFTGLRNLDKGARGLEVRMEAMDAYQDSTKAFGGFRFELHNFKDFSPNHKGELVESWEADLMNPRENIVHWDPITRSYVFKLKLNEPVAAGTRLLLTAEFESPSSSKRLIADEYEFVAQ